MSIKKNIFAPLASGLGATRRAAVLLLVMMLTAMTAWAEDVSYLDASGASQTCSTYTTINSSSTSFTAGWYVVSENVTIADRISVSGTVNLILCNGATLTAQHGITVGSDATFNVYAQTEDEATMGALNATTDFTNFNCAGIGGTNTSDAGAITINGGKITARGYAGAGIGSGHLSVGTITINGGIIDAEDGNFSYGAGIGGGSYNGKAGEINLNGGIISAKGIGSGYGGGDCAITVNISNGVKRIVATQTSDGGACIGKGHGASGTVTVVFKNNGSEVSGTDKDAVFYDSGEGSRRNIRVKAQSHTVTIASDIQGNVTADTEYALTGETITLTLGATVDASTLKVNDGTSDLTLTDIGNRKYTFVMPDANVTVTATVVETYSVTLPTGMEIVSATNAADGNGKYISGTTVTFKVNFLYTLTSDVSDGTNTLTADGSGNYNVTVGTADITVTATFERSSTIDLSQAPGDFTAIDGDVLTGSTSHTVTIANGASITLNDATISGGIACEGTAEITLVGTNSVSNTWYSSAGIQIGDSGTTLTIKGDGSLNAAGGSASAGIGLGRTWDANATGGSVVFEGGNITASGINGIGMGDVGNYMTASIDGIIIKGGTVNASLGSGDIFSGSTATIGAIKIYDTIDKVDASKITESVTYMHVDGNTETDVTASASTYFTIIEDGDRRIIEKKDDTDYSITIADNSENGMIACAATTAKYGDKITITATPDFGYRLSRLVVKDAQNNDVKSTGNSFFMPKSNVTVSAEFEQGVHGTTGFAWIHLAPGQGYVTDATIYDGVTTVNLQQGQPYQIMYDEYSYRAFLLDNDTYDATIPYSGGTGTFTDGNGTKFRVDYNGESGYYDITMTDAGNGKWSVSILKTVGQMDVVPDQTYTGSEIKPEPLVMAGSLSLNKGTDYVYSYTSNTNVGKAKVRATFQGDYESLGYVEKEFTIVNATPTAVEYTITDATGTDAQGTLGFYSDENCSTAISAAEEGATVYIKSTPNTGYELNSITTQKTVPSDAAESRRNTPATVEIALGGEVAVTAVDAANGIYKLTMPSSNVTVEATFTPITYSIEYELVGGTVATANPTEYTVESTPITLNNPTLEGYTFTFGGWTGSNGNTPQTEVTIAKGTTGNLSYKAVWYTEAAVKVVWDDMNDHDLLRPASVVATLSDGKQVTLNNGNNWTAKVEDLPAFDAENKVIAYTWTTSTVDGYELTSTSANGITTLAYSHTPTHDFTFATGQTWMTWCGSEEYALPSGLEAYTVSGLSADGKSVVLTPVETIAADTPLLLKGTAGTTYAALWSADGEATGLVSSTVGNVLTFYGNPTDDFITTGYTYEFGKTYVLYQGEFVLVDNNAGLPAHKCLLTLTTAAARQLTMSIGDETTGITTTNYTNSTNSEEAWYGIDGRKLQSKPATKGLYIYKGKKRIVR